jgi:hypothetical protein
MRQVAIVGCPHRKSERIARNNTEQSRSTGHVGMRPCQLDAALLPSLAITAESLLGPANGSLGLKPSGPLIFKHLIARLAIYETNNAGDKRALQWHILAGSVRGYKTTTATW